MTRFRKKPIEIDAIQFDGTNQADIQEFVDTGGVRADKTRAWVTEDDGTLIPGEMEPIVYIPTLEGTMMCRPGWWVIRGVQGEYYPCDPDVFEQSYEPVDE